MSSVSAFFGWRVRFSYGALVLHTSVFEKLDICTFCAYILCYNCSQDTILSQNENQSAPSKSESAKTFYSIRFWYDMVHYYIYYISCSTFILLEALNTCWPVRWWWLMVRLVDFWRPVHLRDTSLLRSPSHFVFRALTDLLLCTSAFFRIGDSMRRWKFKLLVKFYLWLPDPGSNPWQPGPTRYTIDSPENRAPA